MAHFNTIVSFNCENKFYEKHYNNPKCLLERECDEITIMDIVKTVLWIIEAKEGHYILQNLIIKFDDKSVYHKEKYAIDYTPPISNTGVQFLYR